MHLIPLLRVGHDPDEAETNLSAILASSACCSVALPAGVVAALSHELRLALTGPAFEWVRTGYSEPWFPMLPERETTRQLVSEESVLRAAGLEPGPLWVTGPWAHHLLPTFRESGVEALLLDIDVLGAPSSGVVSHLDTVLPVVPVVRIEQLDRMDVDCDDAAAVLLPAGEPVTAIHALAARSHCDITSVAGFLAEHRPAGRRRPSTVDWERAIAADPDRMVLHRKLVRLVTRLPERLSDHAESAVLAAEAGSAFEGEDPEASSTRMLEARVAVDRERRRGDDWSRVTRLDWAADGTTDLHVETASMSMVVSPDLSASVASLDLKRPPWAASTMLGEPGWKLMRLVEEPESGDSTPVHLEESSVTESRGGDVRVDLVGALQEGAIELRISVGAEGLALRYTLDLSSPAWVGPEMRVAFGDHPRYRLDGSPWTEITGPLALAGHKLRVADADGRQLLASSLNPCSIFIRPGVEGRGLVIWPHWSSDGTGDYRLEVRLSVVG